MNTKPLRIIFMGTPDFALEALKAIAASSHEVIAVYSQPPRPKGRGHKLQASPVQQFAEEKNIPVFHPTSLKGSEEQEKFAALEADIAIVAAYGLLLPKAILEAPQYGCLNIHASVLPRWRGASPIQQAIWKGDTETGITIMQMDEGLDTGPMIAKRSTAITNETTSRSLHDDLAAMGGEMIVETLEALARDGTLEAEPQDDAQKTYAPLLKKEDGQIDWRQSAEEIHRQIRSLNPWPGVFTHLNGQRFKIVEAALADQKSDSPGEILSGDGIIGCGGHTALQILKIQPAGKQAMDAKAALNGGYIKIGEKFV